MALASSSSSSTSSLTQGSANASTFDPSKVPPELWREILHHIEDPYTFQNSRKACKSWSDLLLKDRVAQLFALVLPHVSDYLSKKDIFNCRQVSWRWQKGVEDYLPLSPTWKKKDCRFYINPIKERWVSPLGNTFYKVSHINEFLTEMETTSSNPFPTRTVIFYCLRHSGTFRVNGIRLQVQNIEELFTSFISLLRKFGSEIWNFVYITDTGDYEHHTHDAWMQEIFKLLPNLRKLRLEAIGEEPCWGANVFKDGWYWFKYLDPIPPHLVSLHVGPFYSTKLVSSILEGVWAQLQYLECEAKVVEDEQYFDTSIMLRELPNLRHLNLTRKDFMGHEKELKLLERLTRCRIPKLEVFKYDADQHTDEWKIPLKKILQVINLFAPTLVELDLPFGFERMVQPQLENFEEEEMTALLAVSFPKLKTLGIAYSMVDHPILERVLNKFGNLEKVRLREFQADRMDLRDVTGEYILTTWVLEKFMLLNRMISSTDFRMVELWNRLDQRRIYIWRKPGFGLLD
ncbi:unnamed protein product [Orchesella dallaii]|uniref:F-box domain-containing protein n=1 Tax=Orchesella dallaii TaxID=48710 RepID=A0ABP1R126_9HEXA